MTFVSDLTPQVSGATSTRSSPSPGGPRKRTGCGPSWWHRRTERPEHRVDATGNVVVKKPGTAGKEERPPPSSRRHLDMVNEKNSDVDFDFARTPSSPCGTGST